MTAATFVSFNLLPTYAHPSDAVLQLAVAIASLCALAFLAGLLHTNHTLSAVLSWAVGAVASELAHPTSAVVDLFGTSVVQAVQGGAAAVAIGLAVLTLGGIVAGMFERRREFAGASYVTPLM